MTSAWSACTAERTVRAMRCSSRSPRSAIECTVAEAAAAGQLACSAGLRAVEGKPVPWALPLTPSSDRNMRSRRRHCGPAANDAAVGQRRELGVAEAELRANHLLRVLA